MTPQGRLERYCCSPFTEMLFKRLAPGGFPQDCATGRGVCSTPPPPSVSAAILHSTKASVRLIPEPLSKRRKGGGKMASLCLYMCKSPLEGLRGKPEGRLFNSKGKTVGEKNEGNERGAIGNFQTVLHIRVIWKVLKNFLLSNSYLY